MDGKKKKILLSTGIAFGAAALALGGYGLSFVGKEDSEIPPYAEEEYGEWVVTKEPTCEEKGEKTRSLFSSPDVTQTVEIPALGHEWGEWEETTAPTCITEGANRRECAVCHNYDYEPVPALGHAWGEWETTRAATCLTAGHDTRTCTRDAAHTEVRTVEALGHDWSDWVTVTAPTCTVTGVEKSTCRNDNHHERQRTLDALGHDWNDPVVTTAPDCTHRGTLSKICRNDSLHTESEPIPALGHEWGEWVVTKAPTYFEEGEETRICANDSTHVEKNALPILTNAELRYSLRDGNSYSVWLLNKRDVMGTVVIPATYNGLPVTEIEGNGFASCPELYRVVVLGDNLKKIGSNAFSNCRKLEKIEITSKNLTAIGSAAFARTNLESFAIPEGVEKIGDYLFRDCLNLKRLSLPASLSSLNSRPWSLFYGSALETLTVAEGNPVYRSENNCLIERATNTLIEGTKNCVIPEGVTAIGKYAFTNTQTERIRIADSVKVIGEYAFADCDKLTEVILPDSLEEIKGRAFVRCTALTSLALPASLVRLGGGKSDAGNSLGRNVLEGCTALESITIPESNPVFRVENNCLIERESGLLLSGLKNSVIPEGVKEIGAYAFYSLGIESVVIPASVKTIETNAFARCYDLASVTFAGSNIEYLGWYAFKFDTNISVLEIPVSVTSVETEAFYGWTEEQTVIVKRLDTEEEADALWGADWRRGCNAKILYETGIEYDHGDQLSFALYKGGTEYRVKARNKYLTGTVTIPATYNGLPVTEIVDAAFVKCSGIEKIVVSGNNLKSIGRSAFAYCSALESFEIPEGVTKIGYRAFYQCDNLKSISIPASLTDMDENELLYNCSALETITVAEGNGVFRSEGNCLIDRAKNTLLFGGKNAVIPAGVAGIGKYAFAFTGIERVCIPESVKEIDIYAFNGCKNLSEVVFEGNGLIEIGGYAFNGCKSITCLEIPVGVTYVGAFAFNGWTDAQTIVVKGASEEEVWAAWSRDWDYYCKATIIYDTEEDDGNAGYTEQLTFSLYKNSSAYKLKARRKDLTGTVTVPAFYNGLPVTAISDNAFLNCSGIDKIVVTGDNLESIGNNAFLNCTSLKDFEIPKSVTKIGSNVFCGCAALERIEIPATVTSIGYRAFYGWTEAQTIVVKGFASEEEAVAAWGTSWLSDCKATILYEKETI